MDKELLRECKIKERDLLSDEERKLYSEKIIKSVLELPEYNLAETVMCYASFRSEVDTFPLLKRILKDKKRLLLPRIETLEGKRILGVYIVTDLEEQLIKSSFGILEPDPFKCIRLENPEIDLILCPGVVFDLKCNRIGYGAGFYDRFLKAYEYKKLLKIGLAFDIQIVDNTNPSNFDIPMDKVMTESRKIYVSQ